MRVLYGIIAMSGVILLLHGAVNDSKAIPEKEHTKFIDSNKIRLELNYDKEIKELQIKVYEKDKIELVHIFADKKLLVEFDNEQAPPWDSTIRLKTPCPESSKFYFVIKTKDGSTHRIMSRKTDLLKNGTFVEVEQPRK